MRLPQQEQPIQDAPQGNQPQEEASIQQEEEKKEEILSEEELRKREEEKALEDTKNSILFAHDYVAQERKKEALRLV